MVPPQGVGCRGDDDNRSGPSLGTEGSEQVDPTVSSLPRPKEGEPLGIGGRGQHAANAGSLTPRAMWALPGPECQLPATLLRATSSLPDVPWCVWHTTLAPSPPQAPWFLPQLSVAAQSLCWGGGGISEMDSSTPKGGDRGQTTATSGTDLAACLSNPTRPFHCTPSTGQPGPRLRSLGSTMLLSGSSQSGQEAARARPGLGGAGRAAKSKVTG